MYFKCRRIVSKGSCGLFCVGENSGWDFLAVVFVMRIADPELTSDSDDTQWSSRSQDRCHGNKCTSHSNTCYRPSDVTVMTYQQ